MSVLGGCSEIDYRLARDVIRTGIKRETSKATVDEVDLSGIFCFWGFAGTLC